MKLQIITTLKLYHTETDQKFLDAKNIKYELCEDFCEDNEQNYVYLLSQIIRLDSAEMRALFQILNTESVDGVWYDFINDDEIMFEVIDLGNIR